MLEDGSSHVDAAAQLRVFVSQSGGTDGHDGRGNALGLCRLALEDGKQRIHDDDNHHQVGHVEGHALNARRGLLGELVGKECEREAILVECHPEEDDHGKHQAECHDALGLVLLGEFLLARGGSLSGSRLAALGVAEGGAETIVNEDGEHQRSAGHAKGEVVTVGHAHAQVFLGVFHDFHGCRGSKQCANVDGHVEQRESRVALVGDGGVVVEITHHHLQVALEQACSQAHQSQGEEHEGIAAHAGARGNGKGQITHKHDEDTRGHHLAIAKLVGEHAAKQRQEVDHH